MILMVGLCFSSGLPACCICLEAVKGEGFDIKCPFNVGHDACVDQDKVKSCILVSLS